MRGELRADLEHLERRVGPEHVVHDRDRRAVQHADADGRAGALREPLGVHDRARAQLVEVEVGVAEVQQPGAELVLVRVAVLLDEAVRRQRLQQPVDGRAREAELIGELAHARAAAGRWPAPSGSRAARSTDWIVPRASLDFR